MGERDRNIVELLETAKLAAVDATSGTARAAKAKVAAALREASASGGPTRRLAAKAFAASEFLRELAWTTDPDDAARLDGQRRDFTIAMDRLIFELGVADLKSVNRPETPKRPLASVPATAPARVMSARSSLAARLRRWLAGRERQGEPASTAWPQRRPGDDTSTLARVDGPRSTDGSGDPAAR